MEQIASQQPQFRSGDTIKVSYKIMEGDKFRIQPYEGIVIATKGSGISKTFTVRRIGADGIGVERIFPLASPNIEKIEVLKQGNVRKSKLYYLREKKGRAATKVREKITVPASASISASVNEVEVKEESETTNN